MTKHELSQIRWLKKEIAMWQRELDRLNNQSLVKGQEITGMPHGGSRTKSKVEDLTVKKEEIREKIRELREQADREHIRLLRYIEEIEDVFVRQIIKYRYVDVLSWREVAQMMGEGITSDGVRMAVQRFLNKGE